LVDSWASLVVVVSLSLTMNSFQQFANSLQDPGTSSTFVQIRSSLERIPQLLLSSSNLLNTSKQEDFQGRVSGDFNFHFQFRIEGGGFFQSGVLVAAASRYAGGLPVPLTCVWKRRVGDLLVHIPGVTSNMYQISADDIGTEVVVEASPADQDDGLTGTAIGAIGPFDLDPATRRSLDDALGFGEARFEASFLSADDDGPSRDGRNGRNKGPQDVKISISAENVKVCGVPGKRDIVAEYGTDFPKVILHPLDSVKFTLAMGETNTLQLAARSRSKRDLLALCVRCFHAKKHISLTAISEHLLPVQHMTTVASSVTESGSQVDACVIVERLAKELNRSMSKKEVADRALRNTSIEKQDLQDQLVETIQGFSEVMGGLEEELDAPTLLVQPQISPQEVQEQLQESLKTNELLEAELRRSRGEIEKLRSEREEREAHPSGGGALADEAARLREERSALQTRLLELSTGSYDLQTQKKTEQAHTQELKRLRQDVEALHNQKEYLRDELQEKAREKEDLQQNFLYVKTQLDKVQMKQARSIGPGGGQEAEKHQMAVDAVGAERSELSCRLESLLNDFEKEKAYHEQSVERLMKVNGKLMEEKDRASREVMRLGQLYSEAVQQLKDLGTTTAEVAVPEKAFGATGSSSSSSYHVAAAAAAERSPFAVSRHRPEDDEDNDKDLQQEIEQARAELRELDEKISKRDQENESLKSRIRKLAVA